MRVRWGAAAALLWAASLAVFWPGYALYDSARQYEQALSGRYDDWHPPIMAALWRGLHLTVGGGAGPMLVVQLTGWWAGLGLIAAALARTSRWRAAAVLAIGAVPPWLGWQVAVLKDAQMAGALLAAVGLVAWWRLAERSQPWAARVVVAALFAYAALVRANAIFAIAPLAAVLVVEGARRRATLAGGLVLMVLIATAPITHRLLGADESGVARTEAIFDLAGITVRVPDSQYLPLTPEERAAIITKRCATPYFWDPLGDETRCGADLARVHAQAPGVLFGWLARAVLAHPIAYAEARAAHLNSTERWLVPARLIGAVPPEVGEPNALGLATPGRAAAAVQSLGGWLAATPLSWPIAWTVLAAAAALIAARRPSSPARDLTLALAASAVGQEASFAVVSIASDWRYHLWPTVATALALVLLLERAPSRRAMLTTGGALAAVLVCAVAARLLLPTPPQTYAGMLASGMGPGL